MTTYAWELQQAVYAALSGASLTGVQHIIDHQIEGPTDTDFPYVSIGDNESFQDDVSCADGSKEFFTIHTWSRWPGQKECKQLMGQIHTALHNKSFTVEGLSSAYCLVTRSRILDDPDGKTKHGITSIIIHCREA